MTIQNHLKNQIPIIFYDVTDSTNLRAREYIKTHNVTHMLFVANGQTAGRGRLGRSFYSPVGSGIYMSYAFKCDAPFCDTVHITTASAVAVARAIKKNTEHTPQIKWVNDIYINDKKACGILCEAVNGYIIIGVGINVTTADFPQGIDGTSIGDVNRDGLIADICDGLYLLSQSISDSCYLDYYRAHLLWRGEQIFYTQNNEKYPATLVDIDSLGGLIINENGVQKTLRSGEISIKKQP